MANQRDIGAFLPTTAVFDTTQLNSKYITPADLQEAFVLQYQNYNNIANILNVKDTGYYLTTEINTSQKWFQPNTVSPGGALTRNAYRVVIDFGALPNAATKSVSHNIEGLTAGSFSWTFIGGYATDPAAMGLPIPYASAIDNQNIELNADAANVNITTSIDYSAYTICYVVLEYLKN